MFKIALIALVACWIFWGATFFLKLRRTSKRKADVTVPAGSWGMLLQGCGYFAGWLYFPGPRSPLRLLAGVLLALLGVITTRWAVPHLGRQWRIQPGLYPDHELVRTGPYRVVRHPIYASMLAMYLATVLVLSVWPVALAGLVLFIAGTEIRVRTEDKLLASRFGREFAEYKARVPAYVPFLR